MFEANYTSQSQPSLMALTLLTITLVMSSVGAYAQNYAQNAEVEEFIEKKNKYADDWLRSKGFLQNEESQAEEVSLPSSEAVSRNIGTATTAIEVGGTAVVHGLKAAGKAVGGAAFKKMLPDQFEAVWKMAQDLVRLPDRISCLPIALDNPDKSFTGSYVPCKRSMTLLHQELDDYDPICFFESQEDISKMQNIEEYYRNMTYAYVKAGLQPNHQLPALKEIAYCS